MVQAFILAAAAAYGSKNQTDVIAVRRKERERERETRKKERKKERKKGRKK